jgi:hypothetical protein
MRFTKRNKYLYILSFVLIIFASFLLIILVFNKRGYLNDKSFIGGDEPHYIMMVDSLVRDGDFNLKNDYTEVRSGGYYGSKLFPHLSPVINYDKSDNWYSIHTIGLPLIMYLPYKLGGVIGARLILIILQLATVVVFYYVLKRFLNDKKRVFIGLLLLISCSIFWQNFGGIFPDILLAMFLGLSVLLFGKRGILLNMMLNLLLVLSVITHSKAIPLLVPIVIAHYLYLVSEIGVKKVLATYWSSFAASAVLLSLYGRFLFINYGVVFPSQLYGKNGQLFSANMLYNFLAILFDRAKGVLIYFPILAVSGPYLCRFYLELKSNILKVYYRRNVEPASYLFVGLIIGLVLLFFTQLGFDDWSGSFSPNGRYMLVFILLVIFLIAKYINYNNILERYVLVIFTSLNFIVTFYVTYKITIYLDTGKEGFLAQKIYMDAVLPLFDLVVTSKNLAGIVYSILLFVLLVITNLALFKLYKKPK